MIIIKRLSRKTNWPVAIIIFVVAISSYLIYFNYSEPLKTLVGDQQILDIRGSGYNQEEVSQLLGILGDEGRSFYLKTTLLDTVWPLLLALSVVFFAPLAFGVLDAFENFGILLLLVDYPDISSSLVSYCAMITRMKWVAIPIAFLVFLALPVRKMAQ